MTIFDYQGTEQQKRIARTAMETRCDFPWPRLLPGLATKTGRTVIPLDWQDLSRYGTPPPAAAAVEVRHHKTHDPVIEENGDKASLIEHRHRVLGLAWYSGRVTLEQSLVNDPELAGEVLLAEGAHMWDFFGMTNDDRVAIWNALHPPHQHVPPGTVITDGVDLGHGHGWFDVGGYATWVGESVMGLFVKAFSDYPVTINLGHPISADAVRTMRHLVFPPPPPPEPVPEPEPEYGGVNGSKVYHRLSCFFLRLAGGADFEWVTAPADRRPCRVCRP